MGNSRANIRIISLILVIVMSMLTLVGCLPDEGDGTNSGGNSNNNTGNNSNGNEGGNNNNPDNGTEDSHTCSFGDWVIVKEPTNSVDGLRERKCECGKVEQEVIAASNTEYYIQYRNLKTAQYPSENGYNSKEGLLNLPQPEADGYTFIGWYTASIGGDLVDYIPEGSTKNYILYAHWELVSYEITYKNVPNNTNPTSYNIETKLKLENPKWSGLEFTHWSDDEGNVYTPDQNVTTFSPYTYGDLELTANWKVLRNISRPNKDNSAFYTFFDADEGFVYFYYDLGTIEHVVLDGELNPNLYYKAEGMPLNLTLSETVTISKEKAESISNTISKSISSTRGWDKSTSWATDITTKCNADIKLELGGSIGGDTSETIDKEIFGEDFKIKDLVSKVLGFTAKANIENDFGASIDSNQTNSSIESNYGRDETNESSSNTVLNSLAYKDEITSEIVENYSISAELPSGYYAYVHAGNIRVIGVVGYEIATGGIYLNTYSKLDNMHAMIMYYPDVYSMNNPTIEGLDFTVPEEKIVNIVENSYYVKYNANGGTGTMPTTMHSVNGNEKLAKNEFKKEGCIFAGWELTTDDGVQILQDEQSVSNLSSALQTVTLKAVWTNDPEYDKDVVYTLTTKSGTVSQYTAGVRPGINYTAKIEYRNRTADSIEIRVTWTTTRTNGWTSYGQNVKLSIGSVTTGTIQLVSYNGWGQNSSNKTATKDTGWMTVALDTSAATTIGLKVQYWQTNSNGNDMSNSSDPTKALNTTWTFDIPAAK